MESSLHTGHRDRLRERVAKHGFECLSEHEALELLLFYAIPRRNTNEIAHRLLDRFGSIRNVIRASEEELCQICGVSARTAFFFKTLLGTFGIYTMQNAAALETVKTPEQAAFYARPYYEGKTKETPAILLLDKAMHPVYFAFLKCGNDASCAVRTDYVVRKLYAYHVPYFYLFHNHPNGVVSPSEEDIFFTRNLRNTCFRLGKELLDHIILTDNAYFPIMQQKMPEYAKTKHIPIADIEKSSQV